MTPKLNKPVFIVVDGGDGGGKSTLVNHITAMLSQWSDLPAIKMRALGQGPIGSACRDRHLLSKTPEGFESLMLPMSIVEAYHDFVLPALKDNCHVVMDRWIGSYFAYQVSGRQDKHAKLIYENLFQTENLLDQWPDLYIVGDVRVDVAAERLNQRNNETNYLDQESLDFKEAVRNGFLTFQKTYEGQTILLDCNKSLEEVQRTTNGLLFDLLTMS